MKTNKIYLMFTILLITLVLLSNTVNASASFNLKLNSSKTSYSKGDTVTVNIDLANVTDDSGIAGYQAKLVYDSNVLTLDGVTSNNWEAMQNEGAIVANTKDALGTKSGTTAVATFKVNENTTENSTTIKMTSIKGTSGDLETVEGTSSELKITISQSSGETPPQCEHDYSVTKKDSTNHWKICSKCEAKQESSVEKHSYSKAKNDGETHSYTCTGCGYKKSENHKFGTDGKCTASGCGAIQSSSACKHDYSVTKKDSTNHWKICSKCGVKQESSIEKHSYNNAKNDGETHSYTCTECGYKKTENHKFGTNGKCTASGCNAVKSSQGSNGSGSNGSGSNGSGANGSGSNGSNKGNSSTTTTGKIPYAGAESLMGFVALVAIIGIASYIRYRKTF